MSTTVNLGMLPQNRGQFTTATWPQNISIYKDNIVQYNGSSYIYNPGSFDIEHPEASATSLPPYSSTPATLNTGWAVFASGNNTFTTGQSVDELSIDAKLSHTSNGIPSSSEVFNKFVESGVFDLSAYNAVGGELATYADLGAALTAMNSLSADYKKGGMSVKFVQSSDNSYLQYRLTINTWTTLTSYWRNVEEEVDAISQIVFDVSKTIIPSTHLNGLSYNPTLGKIESDSSYFRVWYVQVTEDSIFDVSSSLTGGIGQTFIGISSAVPAADGTLSNIVEIDKTGDFTNRIDVQSGKYLCYFFNNGVTSNTKFEKVVVDNIKAKVDELNLEVNGEKHILSQTLLTITSYGKVALSEPLLEGYVLTGITPTPSSMTVYLGSGNSSELRIDTLEFPYTLTKNYYNIFGSYNGAVTIYYNDGSGKSNTPPITDMGSNVKTEEIAPSSTITGKYISSTGDLTELGATNVKTFDVEEGQNIILTIANATGSSFAFAFYTSSSSLSSSTVKAVSRQSKNENGTHNLIVPTGVVCLAVTFVNNASYSIKTSVKHSLDERLDSLEDGIESGVEQKKSSLIQYNINDDIIKVAYGYGDKDLEVVLKKRGGNNIFDFDHLYSIAKKGVIGIADETNILNISTDWHAPFVISAVNNIDGDNPTSKTHTGGNHQYNDQSSGSTPTGRTTALSFFVDDRVVTSGSGYANKIEIRWTNLVQGYNTRKSDGTGREILQENHRLVFDGYNWNELIELIALEDIVCETWYGLQFSGRASCYPNIIFVGGENRTVYSATNGESGNAETPGIIGYGSNDRIEMFVDCQLDLGKRPDYSGTKGAFMSGDNKCYFTIVSGNYSMLSGEHFFMKGGYRFMPQ